MSDELGTKEFYQFMNAHRQINLTYKVDNPKLDPAKYPENRLEMVDISSRR